jgi:hypothetical protein
LLLPYWLCSIFQCLQFVCVLSPCLFRLTWFILDTLVECHGLSLYIQIRLVCLVYSVSPQRLAI